MRAQSIIMTFCIILQISYSQKSSVLTISSLQPSLELYNAGDIPLSDIKIIVTNQSSNSSMIVLPEGFSLSAGEHISFSLNLKQGDNSVSTLSVYSQNTLLIQKEIIVEKKNQVAFNLLQNYPNPFNPTTTIAYTIPAKENLTGLEDLSGLRVSLKVYDALGREVATLVNEDKMPGRHEVTFDGSKLSSGVYYYSLKTGKYQALRKFLLLK